MYVWPYHHDISINKTPLAFLVLTEYTAADFAECKSRQLISQWFSGLNPFFSVSYWMQKKVNTTSQCVWYSLIVKKQLTVPSMAIFSSTVINHWSHLLQTSVISLKQNIIVLSKSLLQISLVLLVLNVSDLTKKNHLPPNITDFSWYSSDFL